MHAPHHVPKEWADQYKGQFDDGWDAYRERTFKRQKELGIIPNDAELSRHDPDVQDWNALPADEKKLYSRMMEIFAGFFTHTDYHYGRLFNFLKSIGEWENTLIMFISDNGASSEGGPTGSVNENKFLNNVADSLEQNLRKMDDRQPTRSITTPGAGRMQEIPRSGAGSVRRIAAASAIRSSSIGPKGSRQRVKCAPSMRTPLTWFPQY